ncbi:MAG: BsaWI family type II restriction enzyme [Thermoprotei archaeon]
MNICKSEIYNILTRFYDKIASLNYENNYLDALKHFDQIAEERLREKLEQFYVNQRSRDQAWRSCKGSLYEYAVLKYIQQIINLSNTFRILSSNELSNYKNQIIIRNWTEILPDIDLILLKQENIKAMISCKTSLRERLTETAFWKRELEKQGSTIKLILITIDKDNELKQDNNYYFT